MNDLSKNKILISPIGVHEPLILQQMGENISKVFNYSVEIRQLLDNIEFAFSKKRNQYNSTIILDKLSGLLVSDYSKVIAICDKDLFIPVLTYVFGEAQLNGKSCIISTYRLRDSTAPTGTSIFAERLIKEAVHELGHTFNIRHCPDKSCVMHYCRSLQDVDNKNIWMCNYCSVFLEDEKKKDRKKV